MPQTFDVCIRGAGIVGRTLALLLAGERLRVALVEHDQPDAAASDVRAYALNAASRDLLAGLRCWPEPAQATPVLAMEVHGDDGGLVHFSASHQRVDALAWVVDAPALAQRLAEGIRYQPLVERVAQAQDAPLTVVCEGKASHTRQELGVEFELTPYHQLAIATRLHCEKPHEQVARQWFGAGSVLAFLPLEGAQGNSVAAIWSVDETAASALLELDGDAFAARLAEASRHALGRLTLASERAAWPLQLAAARHWSGTLPGGKAWVLAGDAAHTVHPLAGQGLNLGLADAAALAQALKERAYWRGLADEKPLRRYERARKAGLAALAGTTDGLQRLFARDDAASQGLRNWGMRGFDLAGPVKSWVARKAMGQ